MKPRRRLLFFPLNRTLRGYRSSSSLWVLRPYSLASACGIIISWEQQLRYPETKISFGFILWGPRADLLARNLGLLLDLHAPHPGNIKRGQTDESAIDKRVEVGRRIEDASLLHCRCGGLRRFCSPL